MLIFLWRDNTIRVLVELAHLNFLLRLSMGGHYSGCIMNVYDNISPGARHIPSNPRPIEKAKQEFDKV